MRLGHKAHSLHSPPFLLGDEIFWKIKEKRVHDFHSRIGGGQAGRML